MAEQPGTQETPRMPKVTLYVKDSDAEIWNRARNLVEEESLSSFVSQALREAVVRCEEAQAKRQELDGAMDTCVLKVEPEGSPNRTVKFVGACVYESQGVDAYITKGGTIIVATTSYSTIEDLTTFDRYIDFEEAFRDKNGDMIRAVADALGREYVEEID